jgi:hypothetical protein
MWGRVPGGFYGSPNASAIPLPGFELGPLERAGRRACQEGVVQPGWRGVPQGAGAAWSPKLLARLDPSGAPNVLEKSKVII